MGCDSTLGLLCSEIEIVVSVLYSGVSRFKLIIYIYIYMYIYLGIGADIEKSHRYLIVENTVLSFFRCQLSTFALYVLHLTN